MLYLEPPDVIVQMPPVFLLHRRAARDLVVRVQGTTSAPKSSLCFIITMYKVHATCILGMMRFYGFSSILLHAPLSDRCVTFPLHVYLGSKTR
jgi:hypothetical protein